MTVFLQRVDGQLRGYEERLVYQHCIMERTPYVFFEVEYLPEKVEQLRNAKLLVGSVEAVSLALSTLGCSIPSPNYYPVELSEHLHRKVWKGTIGSLKAHLATGSPVFAKSDAWKLLTGRVFTSLDNNDDLCGMLDTEPLWFSEPVIFLSEYRGYVINGQVVSTCIYEGDESFPLNMNVIDNAISLLKRSTMPAAFAIDFGVLQSGITALVEMGDGFAMGAYRGISPKVYFEFLKTRWDEMVRIRINSEVS